MTIKRLSMKMVFLLFTIGPAFVYLSPLKPVISIAEESRSIQSMEEWRQYHLIKVVQRRLIELGYDPGPVNGMNGTKTQEAIKEYQKDNELIVDGIPGPQTLKSLGY